MQEVVQCKNCGSHKVKAMPLGWTFIILGLLLLWIPLLGLILGPTSIIVGLLFMFLPIPRPFRCEECKHSFNVKYKDYKQYKKAVS